MTGEARPSIALVTATYRGDHERCRLLCDSVDRRVTGHSCHYLLVEERDRALFEPLAGPARRIVSERELLPSWLRPSRDPFQPSRRLWVHPFGLPLRGWHVQQLRRIAFAARMDEGVMLSCDSDVVFVRPFDAAALARDGRVRFYRVPGGLDQVMESFAAEHRSWSRAAGRMLGIEAPRETRTGYITTLVPWRADTVREMLERIAAVGERAPMRTLAATRALSECTIYGRFVDEVERRPERHAPSARSLAHVRWAGAAPGAGDLAAYLEEMEEGEVALCVQSFIGADPDVIRSAVGLA